MKYMSYFEAIKQRGREANPFFMLMGIDVVRIGEGEAVLQMPVRPDMANGVGWLQGGIFISLTDEAMALALYTILDPAESIATVSESTSFFKGARDDLLVATGKVVKKGRRVAFAEGEVRKGTEDGELLARTTAAFAVMR
jgi:acyl-CoA thioesterase